MPTKPPPGSLSSITIDCPIFGFDDFMLKILLVKRNIEPSKGMWALPGGWIFRDENTDEAAKRILEEATGVPDIYMEQVGIFGDVNRFPDERIITIGYTALINPQKYKLRHGPDVSEVRWFDTKAIPRLTFDHNEIVQKALEHLNKRFREEPISFELLPRKFTLPQILSLYESVLGVEMDRRNFRKKMLQLDILEKLEEKQKGGAHRAASLYRFDEKKYKENGFRFVLRGEK
ncbi:MAG: NUDIX domain-containing protein [Bacteroidia bacterium]|nr:NUDIX domain-containing protein [Bacteroidia bacterium]